MESIAVMATIQVPGELMRKVHALLKASKHDSTLPQFEDEDQVIQVAVREYLAKHAIAS